MTCAEPQCLQPGVDPCGGPPGQEDADVLPVVVIQVVLSFSHLSWSCCGVLYGSNIGLLPDFFCIPTVALWPDLD